MENNRQMKRFLFLFFGAVLFLPGSLFAGMGVVTILHWLGFSSVHNAAAVYLGPIVVIVLYVLSRLLSYLVLSREIMKYFPVTNNNIRSHREFYLEHIDKEIEYLRQAAYAFNVRGMGDDYKVFIEGLKKFQEIKALVQNNKDLQREHLVCLNKVFNKSYFMKKLQH